MFVRLSPDNINTAARAPDDIDGSVVAAARSKSPSQNEKMRRIRGRTRTIRRKKGLLCVAFEVERKRRIEEEVPLRQEGEMLH